MNKYIDKAKKILDDSSKFDKLAEGADEKFKNINDDSNKVNTFIKQIKTFVRMVKAHFNGKYSSFSTKSILLMIAGIVYFVTPVDLIPDFIPALGFTDDFTVIFFIYRSLSGDIERFETWEKQQTVE